MDAKHHLSLVAIAGGLAGMMFGMESGVIASVLPFLRDYLHFSQVQEQVFVASALGGAVLGAIIAAYAAFRFGRRQSLLAGGFLYALAAMGCGSATDYNSLMLWRVVFGIALGFITFVAPLYLAEVSPKERRGSMVTIYQLLNYVGVMAAFMVSAWLSYSESWAAMYALLAIPALILVTVTFYLPGSPRWHFQHGDALQAEAVLRDLRDCPQKVEEEMAEMKTLSRLTTPPVKTFFKKPISSVLLLGLLLQVMQQATGINIMVYYAPYVLSIAGLKSIPHQMWALAFMGVVAIVACYGAIKWVEHIGRKRLLVIGFTGMGLCMLLMALSLHQGGHVPSTKIWVLACLIAFHIFYAISAGPVTWVLCAEIFPLNIREIGMMGVIMCNWCCSALVAFCFLGIINTYGATRTFIVFALYNLIALCCTLKWVPETKGVSLERIETDLHSGVSLSRLGHIQQR